MTMALGTQHQPHSGLGWPRSRLHLANVRAPPVHASSTAPQIGRAPASSRRSSSVRLQLHAAPPQTSPPQVSCRAKQLLHRGGMGALVLKEPYSGEAIFPRKNAVRHSNPAQHREVFDDPSTDIPRLAASRARRQLHVDGRKSAPTHNSRQLMFLCRQDLFFWAASACAPRS